jgi:ankyrin repeat protein
MALCLAPRNVLRTRISSSPRVFNEYLQFIYQSGRTALHRAAAVGYAEVCQILVEVRANVTAQSRVSFKHANPSEVIGAIAISKH